MSGDFLDSNVLLYLFSREEPAKREIAMNVVEAAVNDGSISFQVVQEVLNGILRRSGPEDAQLFLQETLVPLWRVVPSTTLYQKALDIHARYRYGFYDSLIIGAALEGGCNRLLSEDLQDGQRIEGLTISNPFAR